MEHSGFDTGNPSHGAVFFSPGLQPVDAVVDPGGLCGQFYHDNGACRSCKDKGPVIRHHGTGHGFGRVHLNNTFNKEHPVPVGKKIFNGNFLGIHPVSCIQLSEGKAAFADLKKDKTIPAFYITVKLQKIPGFTIKGPPMSFLVVFLNLIL